MGLEGNDRSILAITMLGHALVHWFEMSIPILLVVWLDVFPVQKTAAGLIVTLGYAPFGIGALPGGVLTDRFGPTRLIVLCFAGMSLSFGLLAVSPSIYAVGAGLMLWGITASVYHPAGMSLISTGARERGTAFAWHGIAGNVGIALGPFTTATLLLVFEWRLVAALLAVPGVIAVLYGLGTSVDPRAAIEQNDQTTDSSRTVLSKTKQLFVSGFLVVFVLVTVEGLFYRGVLTYLPEILQGLPAVESLTAQTRLTGIKPGDYIFVGLLVVGMTGQYAGGRLTDRLPVERGLAGIFGILAVLAVAFVPATEAGVAGIVLLCVVLGFFLFAIQPFYQTAVAVYTPPDTRGLSYGFTYLGEFGFGATSVALGGFLLDSYSLSVFFGTFACVALLGCLLALFLLLGHGQTDLIERHETETAD